MSTSSTLDPLQIPPQPVPDPDTDGFWAATASGQLSMCRCTGCRVWLQPPLERCRKCRAATAFEPVAGTGAVYSFIVQHRPVAAGYIENVPYVVAIIALDEQDGLRLPGRVVDIPASEVKVGMRVKARLEKLPGGDYVVPVFVPMG